MNGSFEHKPVISVVIPCFNARPWIRDAVSSVLRQGFEHMEVILVDDGSTDGSADLVRQEFPAVRIVVTENQGPSSARNRGTQESRGEFIQYLDADDILAEGKLSAQFDALQSSQADVAYGKWQRISAGKQYASHAKNILGKPLQDPEIDLFTDSWFPPAAYLFRRSIIEKIGGWRIDLPIIQDARFALDCALYGGRFVFCDQLAAYYRVHRKGSVSTSHQGAFIRDCFVNAASVESWWKQHGGITDVRKKALIRVYEYVARESVVPDVALHEKAIGAIQNLVPGYRYVRSCAFQICQKLFGYTKAEEIGYWYRFLKRRVQ